MKRSRIFSLLSAFAVTLSLASPAVADPLPGQVLKFQQLPLNLGLPPSTGGQQYPGHDEWSTAYLQPQPSVSTYQGTFVADDFADNFSTPVVHVKWWGSYQNNYLGNNNAGVQKFLISFESDMPSTVNPGGFSRPDQPLLTQIVTPGALSPQSGTYTETFLNNSPIENLYQYNAELAFPFPQQKDTVYWLKIVALVDPATEGQINWGWHNRDWGIQNTLASPNVTPGEVALPGLVDPNGTPLPVWHFQDDAVAGRIDVFSNAAFPPQPSILQSGYSPLNYVHLMPGQVPGVDGPFGIQNYSEDLAFELYTTPVPEPSMIMLVGIGFGLAARMWRKKRAAMKTA
jgi:hypothetical protein